MNDFISSTPRLIASTNKRISNVVPEVAKTSAAEGKLLDKEASSGDANK